MCADIQTLWTKREVSVIRWQDLPALRTVPMRRPATQLERRLHRRPATQLERRLHRRPATQLERHLPPRRPLP